MKKVSLDCVIVSVRPSVPPVGGVQNLNVGLYAFVTIATFLKLGRIITTIDLYPYVPMFITFDLYLGHMGSNSVKWAVLISQKLLISFRSNFVRR